MNNKINLERNIEEALNSLEGFSRAEANPFLYGKIQQRLLISKKESAIYSKWIFRLAFIVIILFVTNIYCFTSFTRNNNNIKSTGIEAFAKEYEIETTGDNI